MFINVHVKFFDTSLLIGILYCLGTSSRDSLLSWIRLLGATNPKLDAGLPVVFLQASPDEASHIAVVGQQPADESNGHLPSPSGQTKDQVQTETSVPQPSQAIGTKNFVSAQPDETKSR